MVAQVLHKRVGDSPCYLTFDIDCLDPAYALGTGTPVSGGLTSDRVLKIIRGLRGVNIIGMYVVGSDFSVLIGKVREGLITLGFQSKSS